MMTEGTRATFVRPPPSPSIKHTVFGNNTGKERRDNKKSGQRRRCRAETQQQCKSIIMFNLKVVDGKQFFHRRHRVYNGYLWNGIGGN